jgi:glycosyltransferase involved in cell wall biosynthesis
MKPTILLVYPHNFLSLRMGIDSRIYQLALYFKKKGFSMDLLALENFVSSWEPCLPDPDSLVEDLFLYDFAAGHREMKNKESKSNPWKRFYPGSNKKINNNKNKSGGLQFETLPDYAFPGMKSLFKDLTAKKTYDFIIISYVNWAGLLEGVSLPHSSIILDLSDFTTLNLFDMSDGNVNLGALLEEEIRRINLFHKVMCISEDERWFFSQFAGKPEFFYVPHFCRKNRGTPEAPKEYDILFIGSDNPFNKEGLRWYFDNIHSRLSPSPSMLVVGKITEHVPDTPGVTCIPFVQDLTEVYSKVKVCICPLLGGTGIKIKVIEALSYGLPVVSTSKGVVGFPVKYNNGCLIGDTPQEFAGNLQRILQDSELYDNQSNIAQAFFDLHFEQSKAYAVLDNIFDCIQPGTDL